MFTNVYMLVSNSSTIILIAKITILEKFLDSVKKIAITDIVYSEITKKDSFENLTIKKEVEKGRIIVESIKNRYYKNIIKEFKIDDGEASAYSLCRNKKYEGLLTDDRELIKLCRIEGIKFISAIAIIVDLFRKKIITKNDALEKLQKLQGYGRYSNDIFNHFKNMVK